MDFTLHQLRLLTQVRAHGTISAAARAMRCTPSAASQQLSALEAAVGAPVMLRIGRGVQLTEAGQTLARHADIVLRQIETAQADLEQIQGDLEGMLHVSVLESLTARVLPRLLTLLRERHERLRLRTYQLEQVAFQRVLSGELDGAFVVDYPDAPTRRDNTLCRHPVCRDWYKVVVADSDPLRGPVVDLSTLDGRPMISSPVDQACARCVIVACRTAGFEPNIMHEIDDYPSMLNLVAAGAGVALVPDLGLLNAPKGVRQIEVADPFCRHVEFIYRKASADRPPLRAFKTVLDEVAREAGLDRGPQPIYAKRDGLRGPG
ncbi:MAG: LysR substrate-binding domain-containing protein [Myxococcota bacterium]